MEEYSEVIGMIYRLKDRYFYLLLTYWNWEAINHALSEEVVGETEMQENEEIINEFSRFFSPTHHALGRTFKLEIAKFFDKNSQALSLHALFEKIEQSQDDFNVVNFRKFYTGKYVEDAVLDFKPITKKDIDRFRLKMKEFTPVVKVIIDMRNQKIAHDDTVDRLTPNHTFKRKEVEDLFVFIQDTLNEISARLESSENAYFDIDTRPKEEMRRMLLWMRKGRAARRLEIREEHEQKMKKYKNMEQDGTID